MIVASLPNRFPKQHQLPAPSAPKRENAPGFHRPVRRRSDSGVLLVTSTLRLPSSVNATTDCSDSTLRMLFVWLGKRCACPTIAEVWQRVGYERKRIKDRNLQTVWRRVRVDEENSVSAVRLKKMVCYRLCRMAGKLGQRWRQF